MATYIELGTLIVAIVILILLLIFIRNPVAILINSLIAIGVLFLINKVSSSKIPINIFTVGIVAIGGLIGLLLVLVLHAMKIAFF